MRSWRNPVTVPETWTFPALLAYAVVGIALPLNWFLTYRLWRITRSDPSIEVLSERTWVALHISIVVTIFAIVFLNNGMIEPLLTPWDTMVITRLAILSLMIPALRWLWMYYRGEES